MKKKTYHIFTYGCQMNKSDSERIAAHMEQAGFEIAPENKADFVILNLCSVRQSAIDRVWGKLKNIRRENKKMKVVLTGCILPDDKNKFRKKAEFILNIAELRNWPDILLGKNFREAKPGEYLSIEPKHTSNVTAYVPIMTGCNNFCTYCAVPYTRGREISRAPEDVINEVNKLIVQGYKQIILLGQNVNSYQGKDKNGKIISFAQLIKKLEKISGEWWLAFVSSHPKDISDELIKCFSKPKHLIPYFHFALQSGSDKILAKMNRKYTTDNFLKIIQKIRKTNPNTSISTDIIVGFPGETKNDFLETKKIMKEAKFDMAYIAQYSPRPNTAAATMQDNISREEKKKREAELTRVLEKTALEHNKKLMGKKIKVLVTQNKDNYYFGQTNQFKNVKIKTDQKNLLEKFVEINITKVSAWNLEGKII